MLLTKEQIREEKPESYGLGIEYFLTNKDSFPLSIISEDEMNTPVKSRLYGPFSNDVVFWLLQIQRRNSLSQFEKSFTISIDADGREYLEY